MQFKLVQGNEMKGSARGEEKPKLGGLGGFKLNLDKLAAHENIENT